MAARRVAQELGEPVGGLVGYQVRFEEVSGPETKLYYVTEGVLTRKLLSKRPLASVRTVVLDEFHGAAFGERSCFGVTSQMAEVTSRSEALAHVGHIGGTEFSD